MGEMPEVISKGRVLRAVEDALNVRSNRQALLAALQQASNRLLDLAETGPSPLGIAASASWVDDKAHIQNEWLDAAWLQATSPSVEGKAKAALAHALKSAMGPGADPNANQWAAAPVTDQLDIECFWVCDPGHGLPGHVHASGTPQQLEITIARTDTEVALILHTPHPPWAVGETLVPERITVVRRDDKSKPLEIQVMGD